MAFDLVVRGSRVSRIHAMIEWRHSRFVIIDMSTNGTFVKIGAAPETTLQHQELVLHGKGMIGLASSCRDPETDCIAAYEQKKRLEMSPVIVALIPRRTASIGSTTDAEMRSRRLMK